MMAHNTSLVLLGHNVTEALVEGAIMVFTDMGLSLFSVVLNLMIINALREKDNLLTKTHNLVLGNICAANLVSAVLVKSISIVHHGYAVAARVTRSNIAFCMVYTMGHRTTLAVLPWSIVLLCWLGTQHRILHIKVGHGRVDSRVSQKQKVVWNNPIIWEKIFGHSTYI